MSPLTWGRPLLSVVWLFILWVPVSQAEFVSGDCKRIVSLAPSITEVLDEIGIGSHVVGATRYDSAIERSGVRSIGGFLDTNFEAMIQVHPSIVIALHEYTSLPQRLKSLGLTSITVDHRDIQGILDSISIIGSLCGKELEANLLRTKLVDQQTKIEAEFRPLTERLADPAVLVVIGGVEGEGLSRSLYVSGKDGFYADLLSGLGFENAYRGLTASGATFSWEGIRSLKPFAIVHILPDSGTRVPSRNELATMWKAVGLDQVADRKRVFALHDSSLIIPGPHYPIAQRILAETLLEEVQDAE
ncbi:MAG: ABC transporter substrate-binding protein [Bdellovibrionales bacterium]|nr:ABC transporter substrate-binding protein [Bdellovibrionales bacterium]